LGFRINENQKLMYRFGIAAGKKQRQKAS